MLSFNPAAQMATACSEVGSPQTQIISGQFHQLIGQFLIAMNQFHRSGIAVAKSGFGQPNAA